jgi:hypothetical protein
VLKGTLIPPHKWELEYEKRWPFLGANVVFRLRSGNVRRKVKRSPFSGHP